MVVSKAIGERAHGARLEKSLLLPFEIITVALTERTVAVGERWGQIPGGESVCLSVCSGVQEDMLFQTWIVSLLHTWQNIFSSSTEGHLCGGQAAV